MIKKTILAFSVFTFIAVSSVFAQPSKRVAAYNYMNSGEFGKAKIAIDAATIHPKTANSYKVWWYRGNIYQSISINKKFKDLAESSAQKSLEAYAKALVLNFKDISNQSLDILNSEDDLSKFKNLIESKAKVTDGVAFNEIWTSKLPALSNLFINKGVVEFKDNKAYDKALNLFENSLFISDLSNKLDTPIYYYAALAAEKNNSLEKADEFYKVITETGYGANDEEKAQMYYLKAKVKEAQKDTVAYIETLQEGINKYSNGSNALVTELVNHYLAKKESTKALDYLKLAIEKDPSNSSYYFAQGALYDNKEISDSAQISYKKAIELKPDYFDALYNLGASHYNTGADLIEKANNIPANEMKKYDEMKAKADKEFENSLPYLEKAHELNPTDKNTMIMLKTSYYKVGKIELHNKIKAKLTEE